MYWCHFINFFHSLAKSDESVARAAQTCYRPLIALLQERPAARVTVNIDGSLTERLYRVGQGEAVEGLRRLAELGQVELTASAYGGAVLPALSAQDARAAVQRNTEANRRHFGQVYEPSGFVPPEMAYAPRVAPLVRERGCQWVLLDEMAHTGKPGTPRWDRLYRVKEVPELGVFFRDRSLSMGIMYGSFEAAQSFMKALGEQAGDRRYIVTGTEADVFSTRRSGPRSFLLDMMEKGPVRMVTLSELRAVTMAVEDASPVPSSWSSWDTLQF